jgi:hypothetical protein
VYEYAIEHKNDIEEIHHYNIPVNSDLTSVSIEFVNKELTDTKIDSNNDITEDLYIVLERLTVDTIDFINSISKISVYKDTSNKVWKTHSFMSFPGIMKIKIHKNLLYTDWLSAIL